MTMMEFKINLQLFAGEKTEKATPRRREEARKKGQVAKSHEIITVLVLLFSLLALQAWIPMMYQDFATFFAHVFSFAAHDITALTTAVLIRETLVLLAKMVGPVLLAALLAGYLANVVQIGFLFTTETLKFDLNRINPLPGFKRMFSQRAVTELIKAVCKTVLVGYIAFSYLKKEMPALSLLMDASLGASVIYLGKITFAVCWRIILVLFVLAVFDYAYQRYEYEKSLRMSKQELKEEYKNIEGDPLLKSKMKERQRQLATRRMMQDVPKATVVITNPTHVAVALKYEENMNAPELLAKGQDHLAERIKQTARDHGITIVENRSLAWLIYKKVEIGTAIPADLYQAVAEVIAYVYKVKKKT